MMKNLLQRDPDQAQPVWPEDITRMWRELIVSPLAISHPAGVELLRQLRALYVNGGAKLACFELAYHPVLNWYASRNNLNGIDFYTRLLTLPAVAAALPALQITAPLASTPEWEGVSAFTLDGEIALTLSRGGAYHGFTGGDHAAKELGRRFSEALFGDRYSEVEIARSSTPWSRWFHDVAWDQTWMILDRRLNRIWMLFLTDTD